jgi:hypothetical protein
MKEETMDGDGFDELTKGLATAGTSRRRVLKGLGGLAAGLLGLAAVAEAEAAACKGPNAVCGKGKTAFCTNLSSDVSNCGACGNACPAPADGVATCIAGACGAACNVTGFTYCGGECVDLGGDVGNCGACGTACGGATDCTAPICTNGVCGTTPINEGGSCDNGAGTCQSGTCQTGTSGGGFKTPGGNA